MILMSWAYYRRQTAYVGSVLNARKKETGIIGEKHVFFSKVRKNCFFGKIELKTRIKVYTHTYSYSNNVTKNNTCVCYLL